MVAKEIDSKQDLQQEESLQLPAEHRALPNVPHKGKFGPSGSPSPPGHQEGNEQWPLGRPDVAQIKARNFILYLIIL